MLNRCMGAFHALPSRDRLWYRSPVHERASQGDWFPLAKSLTFLGVDVCSFDVGEVAPTISGMKVYEPSHESVVDQVLVEFDFDWCAPFSAWITGLNLLISLLVSLCRRIAGARIEGPDL